MGKPASLDEAIETVERCWSKGDSALLVVLLRDVHRSGLLDAARMASARAGGIRRRDKFAVCPKPRDWCDCAGCRLSALAADLRTKAKGTP